MEGIAPPLQVCIELRMGLENGESVQTVLRRLAADSNVEMSDQIQDCLLRHEQGVNTPFKNVRSPYRKILLFFIMSGLSGQAILMNLRHLETELKMVGVREIDEHVARLPILLLLPLVFFQLPALLLLIFGPILIQILEGL